MAGSFIVTTVSCPTKPRPCVPKTCKKTNGNAETMNFVGYIARSHHRPAPWMLGPGKREGDICLEFSGTHRNTSTTVWKVFI